MGYDAKLDGKKTRYWALTPLVSGGAVANYSAFELVNRETGRAHTLHFGGGGFAFSLGSGGTGTDISYQLFTTNTPVSFDYFNGKGARISSVNAGIIWGYSYTWLTIWPGPAYVNDPMAYVKMGGWGPMLPGGSAGVHGALKITYGAGRMSGVAPMILNLDIKDPPCERLTRIRRKAKESSLMSFPGDVLFKFDSSVIQPSAHKELRRAIELISVRDRGKISIEGHTDFVGKDVYNMALSKRRAEAVKQYFIKKGVYGASQFKTVGHGAKRPAAPNLLRNGRDNPKGQAENRRVDILFNK